MAGEEKRDKESHGNDGQFCILLFFIVFVSLSVFVPLIGSLATLVFDSHGIDYF